MDLSTKQGRREQGQRIQRAVERAGLSIEELAGRIGCSRALIYQYLSGTTLAQPDRLQQIAQETGVTLT
jgi:transcriptional regulator with XRE-family HTH domain